MLRCSGWKGREKEEEVNCTVRQRKETKEIGEEINKKKIEKRMGKRLCEKIKLQRHHFCAQPYAFVES